MKVTVTNIRGFAPAFEAMFMSKRSWTPELANEIREVCYLIEISNGELVQTPDNIKTMEKFNKWLNMLLRMGRKHITLLRFIDITIMTEGLHRAGQDDVDAHARRFDNRIIRNSTRLATFDQDEFSDYYKDKVMTTDTMLKNIGLTLSTTLHETEDGYFYTDQELEDIVSDGGNPIIKDTWVKAPNGYVKIEYKDNKDVKRGLYMLGIPSNFVSQINITEWAHVFKERNKDGGANPEVKEWAESVMEQITNYYPAITREYILTVEN